MPKHGITLHSFVCKVCGIEFKRKDKRHGPFCSLKCSSIDKAKHRKILNKVCVVCNANYTVRDNHTNSKYCSYKCREVNRSKGRNRSEYLKSWKDKNKDKVKDYQLKRGKWKSCEREGWKCKIEINKCAQCGNIFVSRYKRLCCSYTCDMRYGYEKYYYNKSNNKRKCRLCGNEFNIKLRSKEPIAFCSDDCKKESERQKKRDAKLNRDKRIRKNLKDHIVSKRVFMRDGLRCKICGKKLRMDKQVPHPLAPTIDHIIPLSKGGEHSYLNVRSAHFQCNTKRGANSTGNDQLLMFGL